MADQESRRASPISLDLTPWRFGPKHRPVVGSLPWKAGWTFSKPATANESRVLARNIRAALQGGNAAVVSNLRQCLHELVQGATGSLPLVELNRRALQVANTLLCPQIGRTSQQHPKPRSNALHVVVKPHINAMWAAHRRLREPLQGSWFRRIFDAFMWFRDFARRSRELRERCRRARRARLIGLIEQAQQAAEAHDMGTVYRIIRHIAPKTRRIPTCIRTQEGHLLSSRDQFQAIEDYFAAAYDSPDPVPVLPSGLGPDLAVEEITAAIGSLKLGKSVPDGSLPAEVWQLCPEAFSVYLHGELRASIAHSHAYPPEISECSLSLLPKPGKSSRLPKDLRPLGLQDPSARIFATVLKHKVMEQAGPALLRCPQYACSKGKAIDEAILRVGEHCRHIRTNIQQSAISVHAKRAGKRASSCYGGVMLSLDLSKAFDCVPRWALMQSLAHVGVGPDLQAAILSIHERCRYHIRHGKHNGSIDMKRGIRQGCALSPCLYSIFTVWLFDRLAARTSPTWAESCATLFADDTHLHWEIHNLEDLEFCCHCIRETFHVFEEAGMQVNSSKSALVMSLRGNAAKLWLRKRQQRNAQRRWVSVGTPHQPLRIPREDRMLYLGIIASYQNFELQTFRHRLQVARGNRQRLVKALHSAGLALKYRVRMYDACVRSSLTYGLHAVGYTAEVVQRLEQADARFLRAAARSPSHLTHESTTSLRKRLCISSPLTAAVKMLKGRVAHCSDHRSIEFFRRQLAYLSECGDTAGTGLSVLLPCATNSATACDICGQYFPNRRIMLSHRSRKHPEHVPAATRKRARDYTKHTVDGMPQCKHCSKVFTRVEGLKKHLKQACPILHGGSAAVLNGGSSAVAPSVGVAQVPTPRELSHAGRAAPGRAKMELTVQVAPEPSTPPFDTVDHTSLGTPSAVAVEGEKPPTCALIDQPDFCLALKQDWRGLVRGGQYSRSLRTYCAICGQYVHMVGPGLKQHLRLAHSAVYTRHQAEAESSCHGLGLPAESPCRFCGTLHQAPRVHLRRCPVLFQASKVSLLLHEQSQEAQHGRADGEPGGPGPGGVCGGLWHGSSGQGEGEGPGQGPMGGEKVEILPRGREGRQRRLEFGLRVGLQKELGATSRSLEMGRPEPVGRGIGQADTASAASHGAPLAEARTGTQHDSCRDGMLFLDTPMHHPMSFLPRLQEVAKDWTEKNTAGAVKTGLKVMLMMALVQELQTRLEAFREEPEKINRAEATGWISQGATEKDPVWHYFVYKRSKNDRTHTRWQPAPSWPPWIFYSKIWQPPEYCSGSGAQDGDFDSVEVVPFLLWIGLRSNQAHLCYQAFLQLAGNAVTKLLGLRIRPERLAWQPAAKKVEECFKAVSYCDWSNRS